MRQFIIILLVVALALLLPYSLKAQEHADFEGEGQTTTTSRPTAKLSNS